jgi:enoyl-CoA hydratase/carnithine racemase
MESLYLETKGPVAWIWLNRRRQLNAINETTLAELRGAFEALEQDEDVRAIVLAARGLVFCAGFDVAWMASQDAEAVIPGLPGIEAVFDTIEASAKPVIAAVQGAAMGGGLLLTLVADACLASEHAKFGVPEVKLGFFPNLRLIPRLERIAGVRAAKQMVLTGEPVSAATALDWGLVDRVLPSRELHVEAQVLAEQLAALPPCAVQSAKAAFGAMHRPGFVTWERQRFAECWAHPERTAAMEAFLASRRK